MKVCVGEGGGLFVGRLIGMKSVSPLADTPPFLKPLLVPTLSFYTNFPCSAFLSL
jgi:hypothetical protein